jgi:PAS domain-containing protein
MSPLNCEAAAHLDQAQQGGVVRFEWTSLLPDGRTIVTDVRLALLAPGGEQLIQRAAVAITERKRSEAERREAEAQVRQAMELARAQPRIRLLAKPFDLAELQIRLGELMLQKA